MLKMAMELKLPCGHSLRIGHAVEVDLISEARFLRTFIGAADNLSYFGQNRIKRHRCDRVTSDNPFGLISDAEIEAEIAKSMLPSEPAKKPRAKRKPAKKVTKLRPTKKQSRKRS